MTPTTVPVDSGTIPRLRNGDHLSRDEFERRYRAMPEVKKAELIDGVVYMPSPVNFLQHGEPHGHLLWWLNSYRVRTPGVRVGTDATLRLDATNELQPDAVAFLDPAHGGQRAQLVEGYLQGAPELIAEIAASSVSIDRNRKLLVYQRNGVPEYLLWRVEDQAIDWFVLREGLYQPLPMLEGCYHSEVLPGLWLDVRALLAGDLAAVLETLQRGLESAEHSAFVEQLRAAAS